MTRLLLLFGAIVTLALPARADDPKKPADTELRAELMKRVKTDQAARFAVINAQRENEKNPLLPDLVKKQQEIDKDNTKWLKEVVDKHGWPTFTLVGKDGGNAAWLLVQHADLEPKFQRKCLDLMKPLVAKDEVRKTDFAYLTDRVLLAEGKKQLYGTQFHPVNGKWEPRPLEEPEKVDERRKEMGMTTLEQYRKVIESNYGKKK